MRVSDLDACVTEVGDLARIVGSKYGPALSAWDQFSGELPSSTGHGGKGGHSDRTAMLASRSDPMIRDRQLFDNALELARDALREAHRLVLTATVYEKADPEAPACRSCARHLDYQGKATYSPVHGNGLCWWCLSWQRTHGCWPAVKLVELHTRGVRISEQMAARYSKAG